MNQVKRLGRSVGLSLLEVMVTIAIFAMLFSVLMTGWHQSLNAQAQLVRISGSIQQHQHIGVVFRQVVREALNPPSKYGKKFAGDPDGFTLESTSALDPKLGSAPQLVELRSRHDKALKIVTVTHGDQSGNSSYPWSLTVFRLRYVDAKGQIHQTWPRPTRAEGTDVGSNAAADLPSLVILDYQFKNDSVMHQLLASPRTSGWELGEPSPPILGGELP